MLIFGGLSRESDYIRNSWKIKRNMSGLFLRVKIQADISQNSGIHLLEKDYRTLMGRGNFKIKK